MAKPSIVPVDEERRMTVIEHLEELRRVLIISLIAWALATVIGFILSSPIILWQVWTFVAPGLHRNERRFAVGFVASAVALFAMGIGFAFFAMPIALRFLTGIGSSEIQYLPFADKYINFVLLLIAIFGITFELPLAMTMLGLAGIVSTEFLKRNRLKFWIGIFVGANMVTPGVDPFTPLLLTLPLIILFELSILVIRALRK
jgi:sec-independent protein translocase protein TatC